MADDYPTVPWTKIRDLTGEVFGRLTVMAYAGVTRIPLRRPNGTRDVRVRHDWLCRCLCGMDAIIEHHALLQGLTHSCGCWKKERNSHVHTKHGLTYSSIYTRWHSMRQRCSNPHHKDYPRYGGRGITVCVAWNTSFVQFLADMGLPPFPTASLERINNDLGYCPGNVRWGTPHEQANNRHTNHLLTYQGETRTMAQWEALSGINHSAFRRRMLRGWSLQEILTIPLHGKRTRPS